MFGGDRLGAPDTLGDLTIRLYEDSRNVKESIFLVHHTHEIVITIVGTVSQVLVDHPRQDPSVQMPGHHAHDIVIMIVGDEPRFSLTFGRVPS